MDYVSSAGVFRVMEPELAWLTDPAGRILLVDDDPGVRSIAVEVLRDAGYSVREASSGEAALALVGGSSETIDLLVTDMDMPGISGGMLAERLRARQPGLKVLVISGRAPDELAGRIPTDAPILVKPFKIRDLLATVRSLLNGA